VSVVCTRHSKVTGAVVVDFARDMIHPAGGHLRTSRLSMQRWPSSASFGGWLEGALMSWHVVCRAVRSSGGDRLTLTPSNHVVRNCTV